MTLEQIKEFFKNYKKGTFIHIEFKTKKVLAKKYGEPLFEKETSGCYRLGLKYANLKANKNKVIGERPWGVNVEYLENYLLEHNGKYYLKVFTTHHKSKSRYFINGEEIAKQELEEQYNYKSSKIESYMTISLDNILKLGRA